MRLPPGNIPVLEKSEANSQLLKSNFSGPWSVDFVLHLDNWVSFPEMGPLAMQANRKDSFQGLSENLFRL